MLLDKMNRIQFCSDVIYFIEIISIHSNGDNDTFYAPKLNPRRINEDILVFCFPPSRILVRLVPPYFPGKGDVRQVVSPHPDAAAPQTQNIFNLGSRAREALVSLGRAAAS